MISGRSINMIYGPKPEPEGCSSWMRSEDGVWKNKFMD